MLDQVNLGLTFCFYCCGTRAVQRERSIPFTFTSWAGKINVHGFVVFGSTVKTGSSLNEPFATCLPRASIISSGSCSKLIALSLPLRIKMDTCKLLSF